MELCLLIAVAAFSHAMHGPGSGVAPRDKVRAALQVGLRSVSDIPRICVYHVRSCALGESLRNAEARVSLLILIWCQLWIACMGARRLHLHISSGPTCQIF